MSYLSKRRLKYKLFEYKQEAPTDIHQIPIKEVCIRFKTNLENGLSQEEVKVRLLRGGRNAMSTPHTKSRFIIFLNKMFGPFSALLVFCAALCFMICIIETVQDLKRSDGVLLLGNVLLVLAVVIGILSYLQFSKDSRIMETFDIMVPLYANVIRDGDFQTIYARDIVLGDIVVIKHGDRVPADLRLFETTSLKVDNSPLTGLSDPQSRSTMLTNDKPLETQNLVFFCTYVIQGHGKGIAIARGDDTVMGHIAILTAGTKHKRTPLSKEIRAFIYTKSAISIIGGIILMILSLVLNFSYMEALIFFVNFILASIPVVLLIIVMSILSLTAKRMIRKDCFVRNLEAIETLGACTTICTSKVGTLTKNSMTVVHLWINKQILEVNATDTENATVVGIDEHDKVYQELIFCATLCSSAQFKGGQVNTPLLERQISGNMSDGALLKFLELLFIDTDKVRKENMKKIEIQFNSVDKYQLTIHKIQSDAFAFFVLHLKGEPSRILDRCSHIYLNEREVALTDQLKAECLNMQQRFANIGERVLAFCDYYLPKTQYPQYYKFNIEPDWNFPENGYRFLGMIAMIDPPRAGVREAVAKCRAAGIKIIMFSGDHAVSAAAIARSVGIITTPTMEDIRRTNDFTKLRKHSRKVDACVVTGNDMRKLDSDELDFLITETDELVFARLTPQQKMLIVESCQRKGEIVAVTADGVNDSPALKRADVGVAMGLIASNVSRRAADMVLMDEGFTSVVAAVKEGRLIFDNLKKSIVYVLSTNTAGILICLVYLFLEIPQPMSIRVMLCIDIAITMLPAISLSFEKPEFDIMSRTPRDYNTDCIITRRLLLLAYFQIGAIKSAAGVFSYVIVMAENGFKMGTLFYSRKSWYDESIDDLKDDFGQEWSFRERMDLLYTSQTALFVTLVLLQMVNLINCKTRFHSIFKQGMRNHVLNVALVVMVLETAFFIYCPGVNVLLHMYQLRVHWFALPIPFAILLFASDEFRRYLIRKNPEGAVANLTYY